MSREFTTAEKAVLDAARAYKAACVTRALVFAVAFEPDGGLRDEATAGQQMAARRADDETFGALRALTTAAVNLP